MKARLTGWREIGPGTRHFEFAALDWTAAFVPGQFVSVTHDEITRAYSIASPPGGSQFALCANLVASGHLSPWLFSLGAGDEIDFKGPYGGFIPRRPVSDSIFVATGTGIAPFRSMAREMVSANPERRFTLIFGARYSGGLLYHDEWLALDREFENFEYRPTVTRPEGDWAGLTGRVQPHVFEALAGRRDMDVYICGLREMVDDLRAQLKNAGVDRKRIVSERYD